MLSTLVLLLPLPLAPSAAQEPAADLRVGALAAGQPFEVDLRSTAPFAPVVFYRGLSADPVVPANPLLPVVGVGGVAIPATSDATGRVHASLPVPAGSLPPGLTVFFQAHVSNQAGHWVASNVAAARSEPSDPGTGFLVDEAATRLPSSYSQLGAGGVLPADLNRDGRIDVVLTRDQGAVVWIAQPDGTFVDETATRITFHPEALNTVAAHDVDLDGDLDILTAGGGDPLLPNRLWQNDGTGIFTEMAGFPAGDGEASGFAFGDVDGDGDPDLLVATSAGSHGTGTPTRDALYRNDGAGGFTLDAAFDAAPWNDGQTSTSCLCFALTATSTCTS